MHAYLFPRGGPAPTCKPRASCQTFECPAALHDCALQLSCPSISSKALDDRSISVLRLLRLTIARSSTN